MKEIKPQLTLVGAGPGDPELISLKGIRAIREADVILYDALVNEDLLEYAASHCTKIYVGKRAERLSTSQDQINRLIVDYALTHGHVVRLKGGDPFIFGRGGEEIDFARAHGIPTRAVPGISSSTGLTALQQIPMTYRGISESYWVITGSTKAGHLSNDLQQAVGTNATVVVLMGYAKLSQIVSLYRKHGRQDLPIALIQNGSLPNEQVIVGRVENIIEKAAQHAVGAPAIIVLGEVVSKHQEFLQLTSELNQIPALHE
ncbi:MAG: uroporphyrinogen-III C-methyltransferase [Sphingobacterium sp.]